MLAARRAGRRRLLRGDDFEVGQATATLIGFRSPDHATFTKLVTIRTTRDDLSTGCIGQPLHPADGFDAVARYDLYSARMVAVRATDVHAGLGTYDPRVRARALQPLPDAVAPAP